jgi:hypothetical protein
MGLPERVEHFGEIKNEYRQPVRVALFSQTDQMDRGNICGEQRQPDDRPAKRFARQEIFVRLLSFLLSQPGPATLRGPIL